MLGVKAQLSFGIAAYYKSAGGSWAQGSVQAGPVPQQHFISPGFVQWGVKNSVKNSVLGGSIEISFKRFLINIYNTENG